MADSRRASGLKMKKMAHKVENQTRIIQFMACILISLFLTNVLSDDSFMAPQTYVLFLVFFSIGLWVTEAIPPFAVGIMIVGFLVFFLGQPEVAEQSDINVKAFVNQWSNSVIWLLLGGFFLAEGMKKTGLDIDVFKITVSRFSDSPHKLVLAIMLATAIASMVMSNTATTAMMLAAISPLVAQLGKTSNLSKGVLLGVPAAASIGGMGTIIGSPPNAIAVEAINSIAGSTTKIGFFEWMVIGAPVAILLTIIFWFILLKKYPPRELNIDVNAILNAKNSEPADGEEEEVIENTKLRRRIVLSVFFITVILWLTDGMHPIPMAAVSGIPIIALTMLNIINGDDVRQLPWDTLMLVAGGLSLGLALKETGLAEFFIGKLQHVELPQYLLIGAFALITVLASNIMSNTAAAAILIPAAGILPGVNPITLPVIIGLSASCALFLPVSTPPNAIAFSTGLVNPKEFQLGGISIGIIGPLFIIAWTLSILTIL